MAPLTVGFDFVFINFRVQWFRAFAILMNASCAYMARQPPRRVAGSACYQALRFLKGSRRAVFIFLNNERMNNQQLNNQHNFFIR